MNERQYHCLIAGLPDLSFDEYKHGFNAAAFREMLKESLHEEDFEQVKLVFMKEDNENIVHFLETGEIHPDHTGNFSTNDFTHIMKDHSPELPGEIQLPPYMMEMIQNYSADENFNPVKYRHILAEKYYNYVMDNGTEFLKEFVSLDYDIENLRSYIEAGKYNLDKSRFIAGEGSLAKHLRRSVTGSLSKDPEFDLFDEIVSISELASISEKEMRFDRLKWNLIDEMIFFEYFSIERILGYLHKLIILDRWELLKPESGEQKLRNIISGLEDYARTHVETPQ